MRVTVFYSNRESFDCVTMINYLCAFLDKNKSSLFGSNVMKGTCKGIYQTSIFVFSLLVFHRWIFLQMHRKAGARFGFTRGVSIHFFAPFSPHAFTSAIKFSGKDP